MTVRSILKSLSRTILKALSLRARKKLKFDLKLSFIIHVAEKPPKRTMNTQIILDTIEWGVIQK